MRGRAWYKFPRSVEDSRGWYFLVIAMHWLAIVSFYSSIVWPTDDEWLPLWTRALLLPLLVWSLMDEKRKEEKRDRSNAHASLPGR